MEEQTLFGMKLTTVTLILAILVILLLVLVLTTIYRLNNINRKYYALMSGKKGADLEKIIRVRFKEMDIVKKNEKRVTREHKQMKKHMASCINKFGLVKYDAFNEKAGKLSFVIALLNDENSGVVLNSMHTRDGCYTYAKEIIKGESYIPLSDEEKAALENAKTVEEEIEELTAAVSDSPDDIEFDINI